MAQVELRYATIRLIDGYANTGAVNDTPANGDTVLDVDAITGEIPISTRFTVVGSNRRHYVTAQNSNEVQRLVIDAASGNFTIEFLGTIASPVSQTTANIAYNATASQIQTALEALAGIAPGDVTVTLITGSTFDIEFTGTYEGVNMGLCIAADVDLMGGGDTVAITLRSQGGNTHQVTFTPAITTTTGVPADDAVITFSGRTLEVTVGEGNLTYTESREIEYVLDRGNLDTVREGDQVPVSVNLDFVWEFITAVSDSGTPTIEDVIKQIGEAAGWESSDSDECALYAVDLEIEYVPNCGSAYREIILLSDFRWDDLEHNLDEAQVSMTGRANVTQASVSRSQY